MITCEATYPSSASKSAASCNLQGKLQESGDQAKALQLELSNVKTELESAHSKAAADSTVRQKEIEDAKVAQLEDAKKIRELKEQLRDLVTKLALMAGADQLPQNDAKKAGPQLSKPRQAEQVSQQSQDGHWERHEGGGRILVRGGKSRCAQLERQTQSQVSDSDNEAADEAALLDNIIKTAARSDGLGASIAQPPPPQVPAPAALLPTGKQMLGGAFLKSGPYDSGSSNSREDASPPPVPSTAATGDGLHYSESQQGALVLLKMCSISGVQDPSEGEEDAASRSPTLKSAGCGAVSVSVCLSLSFSLYV